MKLGKSRSDEEKKWFLFRKSYTATLAEEPWDELVTL